MKVYVWVKARKNPLPLNLPDKTSLNIRYKGKAELLIYLNGVWCWAGNSFDESSKYPVAEESLHAIEWLSEEGRGWISVEMPPEKKGYYLAWDINFGSEQPMDVLFYQPYNQSWYYKADTFHPTHWQPLPEPPK